MEERGSHNADPGGKDAAFGNLKWLPLLA